MSCCLNFAGRARNKIKIYKQTQTADDIGGVEVAWDLLVDTAAIVEPMGGSEVWKSMQLESRVSHKFIIRWRSSLAATSTSGKYKIVMDGRTFPIRMVRNLHTDLKTYGKAYQEILADDGEAEITG